MYKDLKIMLGILIALGAINLYMNYQNSEELDRLRFMVTATQGNPGVSSGVNALSQNQVTITKNQISSAASHTYFELLLEGIARKQGLSLKQARAAFDKEISGQRRPPQWKWLERWED